MKIVLDNCDRSCSTPLEIRIFQAHTCGVEVELQIGTNFDTSPKIRVDLEQLKRSLQALTPIRNIL